MTDKEINRRLMMTALTEPPHNMVPQDYIIIVSVQRQPSENDLKIISLPYNLFEGIDGLEDSDWIKTQVNTKYKQKGPGDHVVVVINERTGLHSVFRGKVVNPLEN